MLWVCVERVCDRNIRCFSLSFNETPGQRLDSPPIDEVLPRRRLALRTEIDVKPANALPTDHPAAARTWLTLSHSYLHVVAHLDVNGLARCLDAANSLVHDCVDGLEQPFHLSGREPGDECLGMQLCLKENLVGVRVPDRAQCCVVTEKAPYLLSGVAVCETAKGIHREVRRENVNTLMLVGRNHPIRTVWNDIALRTFLLITQIQMRAVVEIE